MSPPGGGRALALAGLVALAPSCERPGGAPSRVPGELGAGVLDVPYPVAEAERIEGAGRQVLHDARFVFIGGVAPSDEAAHALPEPLPAKGPVLVVHHLEPTDALQSRTALKVRQLAFGRAAPRPGQVVEISGDDLEALELAPPAPAVWLVGPQGTCRASVEAPVVAAYPGVTQTLAVGYRLTGCPGRAWAQIGIVADTIPVDFRWVPAQARVATTVAHGTAWDDPLATFIDAPGWDHEADPRFESVWMREIPEVSPRVIQVHRAWLAEHPDDAERPWCEIEVAWTSTDGWTNERWVDPIPWHADAVGPYMLGAFVNGPQVDAVIYDDRLDGLVVVPPGPLDDMSDAQAWRQVFVPTGRYDDVTLAAWGVQPARGPDPVGSSCEVSSTDSPDGE